MEMPEVVLVHFRLPGELRSFASVTQRPGNLVPTFDDVVDIAGIGAFRVNGRYLMYNSGGGGLREVVIFVTPELSTK